MSSIYSFPLSDNRLWKESLWVGSQSALMWVTVCGPHRGPTCVHSSVSTSINWLIHPNRRKTNGNLLLSSTVTAPRIYSHHISDTCFTSVVNSLDIYDEHE